MPHLCSGYTTREGGVSEGSFASLNLGWNTGDEDDLVEENLRRLAQTLSISPDQIAGVRQVHGVDVVEVVDAQDLASLRNQDGDVLMTRKKGILLSVRVADCLPILLVDPSTQAIAAVHAGWRGTLAGVLPTALRFMKQTFGSRLEDIHLSIGPAIGFDQFEVGHGLVALFADRLDLQPSEVRETESSSYLDLSGINRRVAVNEGIPGHQIWQANMCTMRDSARFFSYRRDGKESGRQMGFIGWFA